MSAGLKQHCGRPPDGCQPPFARLALAPDGRTLILGSNNNLLNPGHVYQLQEILGVLTVKDLGKSVAVSRDERLWNHDANWIVGCGGGRHLITSEEADDHAAGPTPDSQ